MDTKFSTPLKAVVGMRLSSVSYWILDGDLDDFAVDEPNLSGGCQSVTMWFGQRILEISWGSDKDLVAEHLGYAYHIAISSTSKLEDRPDLRSLGSASLRKIPADRSYLWQSVLGRPLKQVHILGINQSPQAIELVFPDNKIIVCIGDTNRDSKISDGDEVLIFGEPEWKKAVATQSFFVEGFQTLQQVSSSNVC